MTSSPSQTEERTSRTDRAVKVTEQVHLADLVQPGPRASKEVMGPAASGSQVKAIYRMHKLVTTAQRASPTKSRRLASANRQRS